MLDEATASIDSETDNILQSMIRTEFQHQTVLCIAHRLDTIIDYDRVMVLKEGHLAEFDTPAALMERTNGIFADMVKAGNEQHLRQLAAQSATKQAPAIEAGVVEEAVSAEGVALE